MIFVGIDNGNTGGIVAYEAATRKIVLAEETPLIDVGKGTGHKWVMDEDRAWDMLYGLALDHGAALFITLEKAQSMPDQGVASVFQYGTGYGSWRMAVTGMRRLFGCQTEIAHPATWQKHVLKGIEGDNTKGRAIRKCGLALPGLDLTTGPTGRKRKPHEGLADAGCMALYGELIRPAVGVVVPAPPKRRR